MVEKVQTCSFFTHILWIWILLSVHHIFGGSEGLQETHIDALKPSSSKKMTLTLGGGLWTFSENLALCVPHGSIHQNSSGNNPLKRNQEWNAASLNTHLSWWGTCSIKFWNCKKLNSSSNARVQNLMKDQLLLLFSSQKQSLSTLSNMDRQIFRQIFNCWL